MYYEVVLRDAKGDIQHSQATEDPEFVASLLRARIDNPKLFDDGPSPHRIEIWELVRKDKPWKTLEET